MKISRAETTVLSHSTYQRSVIPMVRPVIPIALQAIHLCEGHEAVKHVLMVGDGMACNCILSAYARACLPSLCVKVVEGLPGTGTRTDTSTGRGRG